MFIRLGKIIKKNSINQDSIPKYPNTFLNSNIETDKQFTIGKKPFFLRKVQKIGSLTLRGGLIGAIISSSVITLIMISIPFDEGISNPLRNFLTHIGFFGGILGLILSTLIFYLGVIITLFHEIRLNQINYVSLKQFVFNKKLLAIISIIVANSAFSFIPQAFLFPFFGQILLFGGNSSFAFPLDVGKELDQFILIEIVEGILEHPDLEPGILGRLIRLIAIGVLICTVFSLIWSLIGIIKEKKQLNEKMTNNKIILESCFNVGVLILLLFEIIRPIWEFADPFGFGNLWWSSFLIVAYIATPFSIFFLIFLITGNFERDFMVLENLSKIKSRLLFSVSFPLILVGYTLILISIPV